MKILFKYLIRYIFYTPTISILDMMDTPTNIEQVKMDIRDFVENL